MCKCGAELNHNARRGMCSPCYRKVRYAERVESEPDFKASRNSMLRQRRADGKIVTSRATQDRRNELQRERRKANPEKTRAEKFSRRTLGEADVKYIAMLLNDPCSYCSGPGGTVDHIVPIAEGGTNDWWNLTAACKPCNSGKCAQPMLQYLGRK